MGTPTSRCQHNQLVERRPGCENNTVRLIHRFCRIVAILTLKTVWTGQSRAPFVYSESFCFVLFVFGFAGVGEGCGARSFRIFSVLFASACSAACLSPCFCSEPFSTVLLILS